MNFMMSQYINIGVCFKMVHVEYIIDWLFFSKDNYVFYSYSHPESFVLLQSSIIIINLVYYIDSRG